MVITERAKTAVLEKLSTLPATIDAIAIYQTAAAELDADSAVTATPEYPGWQIRFVPSGHLPPNAIATVDGVRIFPKGLLADVCLDYEANRFIIDGETVHAAEVSD